MAYQAIVYDKAALALFMLQDLLGRETFESGLRGFFDKKKFGPARTGEFIAAMESASGRDLRPFLPGLVRVVGAAPGPDDLDRDGRARGVRIDFRVTQAVGPLRLPALDRDEPCQ